MNKAQQNYGNYLKTMITILGWIAVLLQLYLIILNRTTNLPETIARFFSFFTIETNILVAVCFTFLCIKPYTKFAQFFQKSENITAITLYILIVGIVYNLILRFLWAPTGYQKIADELLHTFIPILVLVYWWFFAQKSSLQYKHIISWLIFPTLFLFYTLIRGYFVAYYPYPFLDVTALGISTVLKNSFFMVLAFLLFGLILIFAGKNKKKPYEIKEQ